MKLRSKTSTTSRQSISSHKFITSTNKETCTRGSVSRQEHLNDEFISSMPSTSKNITNTSSTPLSVYGTRRSSTASAEFSPDSPGFGRVAKSNARLLNGLDLTRKSGASSSYLGTAVVLPELKTFELSEKCPTLFKLLKTGSDAARKFSAEQQLTTLQFELEELCAQNVDYQSTIHGEITYLTTGEYPTVNLRNRAMPIFTKVGQEEIQKLAERVKRSVPTPTSMSLADLGILSSPEDDEETPHILDVPQRFWTWAKEYLRHINLDYVNEFKEKMLDRFSEENIIGNYCSQLNIESVSSSIPSTQQNSKTPNNIITSINKSSKKRKRVLSSSSGSSSDSSASVCVTPLKKFNFIRGPKGRFKKQKSLSSNTVVSSVVNSKTVSGQSFRSRAASEKFAITKNSNGSSEKLLIEIDTSSIMTPLLTPNGLHPCLNNTKNSSNGLKSSQNDAKQQKQIKETPKIIKQKIVNKTFERTDSNLRNCFKFMSEEDDDDEDKQEEESDGEEEEFKGTPSVNGRTKNDYKTSPEDANNRTNEISVLLRKKQERLRELFYKSRPTIETLYARILKEYAVHEAIHRMDEADNKVLFLILNIF